MAVYSSLEHPRIVSIPFLRGVCDATGCLLRVYLEGQVLSQTLRWLWACLDRSYSEASWIREVLRKALPTRSSSRLAQPDPDSTTS